MGDLIGEAGAFGLWGLWGVVLAFWKACGCFGGVLLPPSGLWYFPRGASLGAVLGHPKADYTLLK